MSGASRPQPLAVQLRPLVDEFGALVEQTMPISFVDPGVTIDAVERQRERGRAIHLRMLAAVTSASGTGRHRV